MKQYAPERIPKLINTVESNRWPTVFPLIKSLDIEGNPSLDLVFKILEYSVNLEFIELPDVYFNLVENVLPASLKTLSFSGVKNVRLSKDFHHQGLVRLKSWPMTTGFTQRQIPAVTCFDVRTDPQGKLLLEISKAEKIDVLRISHQKDLTTLPSRDWSDVKFLLLVNNQFTNMNGIEQFTGLTDLYINDNPKLSDLSLVSQLDKLKEVTLGYSKAIKTLDFLSSTKIKKLTTFGCQQLKTDRSREILSHLPLVELNLS